MSDDFHALEARRARVEAKNLRRRLRVAERERDDALRRRRADLEARLAALPAALRARAPVDDLDRLSAYLAGVEMGFRSRT